MQSCMKTSIVDLDIDVFYGIDKSTKILYFFLRKNYQKECLSRFFYKSMFYNKR